MLVLLKILLEIVWLHNLHNLSTRYECSLRFITDQWRSFVLRFECGSWNQNLKLYLLRSTSEVLYNSWASKKYSKGHFKSSFFRPNISDKYHNEPFLQICFTWQILQTGGNLICDSYIHELQKSYRKRSGSNQNFEAGEMGQIDMHY